MKRTWKISLLSVSVLALVACGNDKPANDASSETSTTSARYPDGTVSSNVNDTSATGAATNTSPKSQPGDNPDNGATSTTAAMNGTGSNNGSTTTPGTPLWGGSSTGSSTGTSTKSTTKKSTGSSAPAANDTNLSANGNGGNASGASGGAQPPGMTAPPPPNAGSSSGSSATPIDQGNGQSDLKITQAIRKEVVGNSDLSFTAKNVKIITKNGHVVLKGEVKTQAEKQAIEGTAFRVAGNANVDDQIVVKP
ncbi:MAG TPA: BON domain-containing protein [Polyangiaceae bacterium]